MSFADKLLGWFDQHGRHDLPWQKNINHYRVWVSEIMLQQTQVKTVIPYYQRFMQRFPDVASLAEAELDEVLHHWTGLGYYARGRNLHKAAVTIMNDYSGVFPNEIDQLVALPGVGRSTAAAILSIADGQQQAILDGNVKRVLSRFHAIEGWPGNKKVADKLWLLAEEHTPAKRVADYNQAIMDLGATVCTRSKPDCEQCPFIDECRAYQENTVSAFPNSKPKKDKPVKKTFFLILAQSDGSVLLEQRPASGIWGGLWSFPETDSKKEIKDRLLSQYGFHIESINPLQSLRHTFSHFHLDIDALLVKGQLASQNVAEVGRANWYTEPLKENLGLAAPVKKLLQLISSSEAFDDTNSTVRKAG